MTPAILLPSNLFSIGSPINSKTVGKKSAKYPVVATGGGGAGVAGSTPKSGRRRRGTLTAAGETLFVPYENSDHGFRIVYPSNYRVDKSSKLPNVVVQFLCPAHDKAYKRLSVVSAPGRGRRQRESPVAL